MAAAPASILDGGSVIVVGEGRLVNIFFFFFFLDSWSTVICFGNGEKEAIVSVINA